MADLGASVNIIPKSMFKHLKLANLKKTDMLVEMDNMTERVPIGIVKNILVKIDKFLFPSNNVVIDMLNTRNEAMILGRPFLETIHAKIDVFKKEISLGIGDDKGNNTYWWYDHGLEENERQESRLDIEEYDPPEVQVEKFKVQRNDPKRSGHRREGPKKDVECLECNLKTRSHNKEMEFEVTSTRILVVKMFLLRSNCFSYAVMDIASAKKMSIKARDTGFRRGTQANDDAQGYLWRNLPAGVTP
ncbi:putative reverse transcriptase domain-containing protein [Tanacetum coccineum]